MSAMPKNLSDAFCQLAMGITDATRSHYTNDEEHVITVERPFIVSGIAQHLTERADLASRAVKLYLPPLRQRAGRIPPAAILCREAWGGIGKVPRWAGWRATRCEEH